MASLVPGVNGSPVASDSIDTRPTNSPGNFTATLKQTLDEITQLQARADQQVAGVATGQGEDLPSAMIAVERANVAFELMVEVRNKIVQAYQEVSQMAF